MIDASLPDSSELTKENLLRSGWKEVIGSEYIKRLSNLRDNHTAQAQTFRAEETGLPATWLSSKPDRQAHTMRKA